MPQDIFLIVHVGQVIYSRKISLLVINDEKCTQDPVLVDFGSRYDNNNKLVTGLVIIMTWFHNKRSKKHKKILNYIISKSINTTNKFINIPI